MDAIGVMPVPEDFRYLDVFLKGKPQHDRFDPFRVRHPSMDVGHRAKIFAPFDALKGFSEAIASKDVQYESRIELMPEDADELSRRLSILHNLTFNSRMARANHVKVSVTYYEPCSDKDHDAYGIKGRYKSVTGVCWNVDTEEHHTILIDRMKIPLEDVLRIESSGDIFRRHWEEDNPQLACFGG